VDAVEENELAAELALDDDTSVETPLEVNTELAEVDSDTKMLELELAMTDEAVEAVDESVRVLL